MRFILILLLYFSISFGYAQEKDTTIILLSDRKVQFEATDALNNLYNFNFKEAEEEFRNLRILYGWHPLPHFLMGLSQWWRIMPNLKDTSYDDRFLAYMDTTIMVAENLIKKRPEYEIEASFFLAAAYGFKGRLYSEEDRKQWRKAAVAGKNALKYLEISKGNHDLNPELLFGDGLYNYFSVWIPENYPLLKPILVFFSRGEKELGIQQLKQVSQEGFYTRVEAQVFLMRILGSFENDRQGALQISEYLYQTFPENPYFHRYYARLLYSTGKFGAVEPISKAILQRIDSSHLGYEATSGRYAAFFLGQINETRRNYDSAIYYYEKAIEFSEAIDATETGFYHYSMLSLGKIYSDKGEKEKARYYLKKVRKNAKRKDSAHKRARDIMKDL